MLQSCLQLKCDIEDIVDQLEREKWVLEWKKRKEGGKDIANVITGNYDCDIEDIVDQLEREKWVLEWKKRKDGGKDIANVITGYLPYRLPTLEIRLSRVQ